MGFSVGWVFGGGRGETARKGGWFGVLRGESGGRCRLGFFIPVIFLVSLRLYNVIFLGK